MKVKLSRSSIDDLKDIQTILEVGEYLNYVLIGASVLDLITSSKIVEKIFIIKQSDFEAIGNSILNINDIGRTRILGIAKYRAFSTSGNESLFWQKIVGNIKK